MKQKKTLLSIMTIIFLIVGISSFGQYKRLPKNEVLLGVRTDIPLAMEVGKISFEAGYRYERFALSVGHSVFQSAAYLVGDIWGLKRYNDYGVNFGIALKYGYKYGMESRPYWKVGPQVCMGNRQQYRLGFNFGKNEFSDSGKMEVALFFAGTFPFENFLW